jgi:hypothetical protein
VLVAKNGELVLDQGVRKNSEIGETRRRHGREI